MELDTLLHSPNNNGENMKTILLFEKEEADKLLDMLGLADNIIQDSNDSADYFNAWHFGKKSEEGNYVISTSSICYNKTIAIRTIDQYF